MSLTSPPDRKTPRPVTFFLQRAWLVHRVLHGASAQRIVTANDTHTPAAPYSIVNDRSLLDVSDLVSTRWEPVAARRQERVRPTAL
jgi:hypothetical protein